MQLPVAEDLLRNTENFNIAFGNFMRINSPDSAYNENISRPNISM